MLADGVRGSVWSAQAFGSRVQLTIKGHRPTADLLGLGEYAAILHRDGEHDENIRNHVVCDRGQSGSPAVVDNSTALRCLLFHYPCSILSADD
jgi:hypothetical protein